MVGPRQKRKVAEYLENEFKISERKACKTMNLARSTKRRSYKRDDSQLIDNIHQLSYDYPYFGYRKIHIKLKEKDLKIGKEKVRILRKEHGLQLSPKKAKKRRLGLATGIVSKALYPNHVWTYDFIFDQTEDARSLKWLTVVDEYSRKSIANFCARSFNSKRVISSLKTLIQIHGNPKYIRSDNGSEFIAKGIQNYLKANQIKTHYIKPASPWENAYGEGFNAIFRTTCLNRHLFSSPSEAQMIADIWRDEYNNERPHGGLKMLSPNEFIRQHHEAKKAASLKLALVKQKERILS